MGFSDSTFKRALYCLHHRSFRLRTFREAKFNLHKFSLCAVVKRFCKIRDWTPHKHSCYRCVRSYRDNGLRIQSGSFRADDVYQSGFSALLQPHTRKIRKVYKFILDLPIIGTLLYNFASARSIISRTFSESYFYNPYDVNPHYIDKYHESATLVTPRNPSTPVSSVIIQNVILQRLWKKLTTVFTSSAAKLSRISI